MSSVPSAPHSTFSEMQQWLQTPPGAYVLSWEQAMADQLTADRFGFHALQLGWPGLKALAANRMANRWFALQQPEIEGADLIADFCELPLDAASMDLMVLPHTLEFVRDPHACLREVERVLMPEGRVLIFGFNHWSLWGARQAMGKRFLPREGHFLAYKRCKDWLRLLGFELELGQFGCYRPPLKTEKWLTRYAFMERKGEVWWPPLGAVYCIVAVKRVRAMTMNPAWRNKAPAAARLSPAVNRGPMKK